MRINRVSDIFTRGRTAVIFGAASGIGLAAAQHCLSAGMRVIGADRERPDNAGFEIATLDVGDHDAVMAFRDRLAGDDIALVMNNAGHGAGAGAYTDIARWRKVFDTNFWGVVHGVQAFAPLLVSRGKRTAIVNTGSKQGITNPPGDPAYNATKAAVRSMTESLAHALRNENPAVSAHLLIPGFTYTGLIAQRIPTKPDAAWTAEQVVAMMAPALDRGDFYILCPDNETTTQMDALRMAWGAADIAENRPALSRWHPDFKDAFAAWMAEGLKK
jgi:NAD(P)-dependent dehydrogenase (short-subunit alcohol dehydrogenase family)